MKKLMAQEESMVPNLFYNLKRALMPIMHDETYQAMESVTARIDAANATASTRTNSSNTSNKSQSNEKHNAKRPFTELILGDTVTAVSAGNGHDPRIAAGKRARMEGVEVLGGGGDGGGSADKEDGDAEEIGQKSSTSNAGCTSGYCPPCFELA
mmetsp:Transcript_354/g.489  ORF Transcript_354/g.489 Transcript_354/m.489 type:complete len:154 (+) Transcript_354:28-489(+)